MNSDNDIVKTREIRFCHLHPDTNQARNALLLLSYADGIIDIQFIDELCISISYDIRVITLEALEGVLVRLGYHLDNSLIYKMKRALYAYTENTQRANLDNLELHSNNTTKIFIKRYANHQHNCRDKRPEHWRKYL
ncbi:MAG: hypothetical protein OEZ38_04495 [Gammaproteobacteria bacterium]|nr:hypothetical protein [Gammaproteobacteria bacterium]